VVNRSAVIAAVCGLAMATAACARTVHTPYLTKIHVAMHKICKARQWPLPVPNVVGSGLGDAMTQDMICFDLTGVSGPDGIDVLNLSPSLPWKIVAVTPATGTPVGLDDPITIRVAASSIDYLLAEPASARAPYPKCLSGIASWDHANGATTVTAAVIGPTRTTVTISTKDGRTVSASAAVAKLHSGHNFRFKIDPLTISSVLVTTTTGYYGIGGSCLVQHQPTHPNPPGS